jgi:putative membrane protein insertion efficiency factor
MQALLVFLIKLYRYLISPWVGQHCRFHPSCSAYALTAIERFGALQGSYLAAKRLCRCHPWHEGGIDPVPEKLGNNNG